MILGNDKITKIILSSVDNLPDYNDTSLVKGQIYIDKTNGALHIKQ
jgi:hypothetical protein